MNKNKSGLGQNLPKLLVLGVFGVAAVVGVSKLLAPSPKTRAAQTAFVEPKLTGIAVEGKALFNDNCAACHGVNALGTQQGPPFLHAVYNPGHHSDEAFYFAAAKGVRQHHWPFGNMPAQPQVDRASVSKIIAYVRELQEANGIVYQLHQM